MRDGLIMFGIMVFPGVLIYIAGWKRWGWNWMWKKS